MKCVPAAPRVIPCGRSPCGERGLKCCIQTCKAGRRESLPVRGAWIEIALPAPAESRHASLPVRGAWIEISVLRRLVRPLVVSLPVRGAWIEISCGGALRHPPGSLPVRGAWVEISWREWQLLRRACRSPCGERGLKSNDLKFVDTKIRVAPRAGSVG